MSFDRNNSHCKICEYKNSNRKTCMGCKNRSNYKRRIDEGWYTGSIEEAASNARMRKEVGKI